MAQNALIQVRVDDDLKETADILFTHLGMDTPTAIRIFLRQSIMKNGLPFEVTLTPNVETISALNEANILSKNPNVKQYSSFSELLEDVKVEMQNEI